MVEREVTHGAADGPETRAGYLARQLRTTKKRSGNLRSLHEASSQTCPVPPLGRPRTGAKTPPTSGQVVGRVPGPTSHLPWPNDAPPASAALIEVEPGGGFAKLAKC